VLSYYSISLIGEAAMKILSILFIAFLLLQFTSIAQEDADPNAGRVNHNLSIEAMWDVLLEFDAAALSGNAGNAGAEWDGTSFYSTRWASNLIHEYSADGTTLIREFSVAGVTGLRDLAFDGTYIYGGANTQTIYQMDFATSTLTGTIPTTVPVRHIAYDSDNDAFWVGNWETDIVLIDRSGNELARIPANPIVTSNYGSCYDNVSAGGPFLWVFSQSGGPQYQFIHQLSLPNGTVTGVAHDVLTDIGNAGAIAGGLFSMTDFASGFFTIGGLLQGFDDVIFVYEVAVAAPPCPVGIPDNPTPVSGANDVSINLAQVSWDNGTGTLFNDVYFGEAGNVQQVYSGNAVNSYSIPAQLKYSTDYQWSVICRNDTCQTLGPTWTFTTMADPYNTTLFEEDFDGSWTGTWTITNNGGFCDWIIGPDPGSRYTTPGASGNLLIADADLCGSGMNTTATMDQDIFITMGWHGGVLGFAHQFNFMGQTGEQGTVEYSIDEGATWTVIETFTADISEEWNSGIIPALNTASQVRFRFIYITPGWDWWWAIDNIWFDMIVPVELTYFTASTSKGKVFLNWTTATEINNLGFEIERKTDNSDWIIRGFKNGAGTTTEPQNYSFIDDIADIKTNSISYRLKQIDFDGSYEYSEEVLVDNPAPVDFALHQNYPNPFNPVTTISYSIPIKSQVELVIYNTLGERIKKLVNEEKEAGRHSVDFDATVLPGGVYFYRLQAGSPSTSSGQSFVETKKMVLLK
jgi:hypothetical protein